MRFIAAVMGCIGVLCCYLQRQEVSDVFLNVEWFNRKPEDNEMAFRLNVSRLLRLVLCAVVVLAAFGAQRLHAQAVGATLAGTVTDPSGSVVPKSSVAISNTATGETRTIETNADGLYSAPNLQPGNYSVTVTAAGFSKSVQNGVVLTVGGSQTLNFTMQVGQTSQTVEVTAEAPTVNLTNAEIGAITDEA